MVRPYKNFSVEFAVIVGAFKQDLVLQNAQSPSSKVEVLDLEVDGEKRSLIDNIV